MFLLMVCARYSIQGLKMLQIKNLSIGFTVADQASNYIVRDVNLEIASGQVYALVGESGSGKSMTALSIMRLLPTVMRYSQESKIYLHGKDLLTIPEKAMRAIRGANIALIFQDPMTSLNPILTVGVQLLESLGLHQNLRGRHAYIEALRLLEAVQLVNPTRCFASYPHQLSGGMRQRVVIAMALAGKPELLIADEPTTALDVITQRQILNLLQDLQRNENMAMLLITHDLSIAKQFADRIGVMRAGALVEQNNKTDFFSWPQHDYSKKLLACTPQLVIQDKPLLTKNHALLTVTGLNIKFPIKRGLLLRTVDYIQAVDNVDLTLIAGQTLGVVGGSGSGKSTLGKALLGLLPNVSGTVEYAGKNLLTLNYRQMLPIRAEIQIIFQDPFTSLNPKLRVIDSLEEGLLLHSKMSSQVSRYARIDQLLSQVGLQVASKWRYPHEFSGGERQRLCIARALAVEPKIIICDEPTSSLDVSVQAQIINLLIELQQQYNLTYLFISHDLKVVSKLAHEVAVMQNGQIIEYGRAAEVFGNPQQPYTRELLQAIVTD